MSVIKNKSTQEGREFWDHIEKVAAQVSPASPSVATEGQPTSVTDQEIIAFLVKRLEYAESDVETAEAMARVAEQALRRYGAHDFDCPEARQSHSHVYPPTNCSTDTSFPCTCGLANATANQPTESHK